MYYTLTAHEQICLPIMAAVAGCHARILLPGCLLLRTTRSKAIADLPLARQASAQRRLRYVGAPLHLVALSLRRLRDGGGGGGIGDGSSSQRRGCYCHM